MKPTHKNLNINLNFESLISLSIEELIEVNRTVLDIIKFKENLLIKERKNDFSVGDKVTVDHEKLFGVILTIDKIKTKKARLIHPKTNGMWNVPISMITKSK